MRSDIEKAAARADRIERHSRAYAFGLFLGHVFTAVAVVIIAALLLTSIAAVIYAAIQFWRAVL